MIHGIGVDLIEIDRIKVLYSKQPKLVQRILTKINSTNSTISHMSNVKLNFLAGRFASKKSVPVKH